MKLKYIVFLVLLLLLLPLPVLAGNHVTVVQSVPMRQAVSGHYAGWIDGTLWTWGGCNFPDVPCAKGGEKKFYPQAYGASLEIDGGVLCLGGLCGKSSLTTCEYYPAGMERQMYTPLPVGLDNFGAAFFEGYVYLAGGESFGKPNRKVYYARWEKPMTWKVLTILPDKCRLQPCVEVQNTPHGEALFVFGGYQPRVDSIGQKAIVHADGVYFNLSTHQWKRTSPCSVWVKDTISNAEAQGVGSTLVREAIVGATSAVSGCSHVLFFGGVDYGVFYNAIAHDQDSMYLMHKPDWYHFRRDVLVYHTVTDSWALIPGDSLLARAGACLTNDPENGGWYMSGGETMPGIRTSGVSHVSIDSDHDFGWLNWTVLILYLAAMLGMGVYFMRREGGADDFFRGGGRIPWWAAGISIYATMLSALTYMGIPAKAYTLDWTYYPMLWMIPIVGLPVIRYYLPYFRKLRAASAYEILENRFNATTRLMASALFCIFMVARMALVLYLPSLALTAVTGINIYLCILLMGIVTIVYCTMGGVEAVIWGDVIQGIILVGGAIFAAGYLIINTQGGFSGYVEIGMDADKFRLFDFSNGWSTVTWWVAIFGGGLANNLISYTSDQTVIQRYMTTPDEKAAGRSIMTNGFMSVFVSVAFYIIGTGLYTFYKSHPDCLDVTMQQNDAIFPYFMMGQMPAGIAGLLIAAIFAATMSTISSNINSVSTAFSVDFYQRFRPTTTDTGLLKVARGTCITSGLIGLCLALLMATWNIQSMIDYFNTILGLLTSGLGGLFFLAVFCKRVKGHAALTGFIAGEAVVFCIRAFTSANQFTYGLFGMIACIAVAYLVSFVTRK